MIRVLLVDDHTIFRQSLALMLDGEPNLQVSGTAGTIAGAAGLPGPFEVALVDLGLPDGSGIELIPLLSGRKPRTGVLVLTASEDPLDRARAIEAGASGVLPKAAGFAEIVAAIRTVATGEHLDPLPEVIELLRQAQQNREERRETDAALARLTSRERDVLALLAEGLSDREMAERLVVGIDTVHTHMTGILTKLGVESRLQALILAVRSGAVTL